jgi:hypothetical protein
MKQIFFILIELLYLNILSLPLVWEINNDRKGDKDKTLDVFKRGILAVFCALIVFLIGLTGLPQHTYLSAFCMSIAIHFLIFDYLMAATLGHGDWFSYLGDGPIDNIHYWRTLKPWGRFAVRMAVLALAVIFYF